MPPIEVALITPHHNQADRGELLQFCVKVDICERAIHGELANQAGQKELGWKAFCSRSSTLKQRLIPSLKGQGLSRRLPKFPLQSGFVVK